MYLTTEIEKISVNFCQSKYRRGKNPVKNKLPQETHGSNARK